MKSKRMEKRQEHGIYKSRIVKRFVLLEFFLFSSKNFQVSPNFHLCKEEGYLKKERDFPFISHPPASFLKFQTLLFFFFLPPIQKFFTIFFNNSNSPLFRKWKIENKIGKKKE